MSSSVAPNSKVLVPGAGGYLGSAIVFQLLQQGFRLDLFKEKAEKQFGPGSFEVVEVRDLSVKGALDDALKGVEGVVNVASDMSSGHDVSGIVASVVSLNKEVLTSVQAAGSVKSFVSTSSRIAAFKDAGAIAKIDRDTWFNDARHLAETSEGPLKGVMTYAASKVEGEKAVWNFVETEKPKFRVNVVNPDFVTGKVQNPAPGNYSSATSLFQLAEGKPETMELLLASPGWWFVDVQDTAKLHVAALLDDSVDKQRFYGASGSFGAVVFQQAVKAAKPNFKEKDYSAFPAALTIPLDNKASEALLRKHYGHGFKNLTDSVREALVEA